MHLLAMRKADPEGLAALIAKRRVERGIRWLNLVRPHDWWKHFYHNGSDSRFFYTRDEYNTECPLALAFKSEKALQPTRYVTYANVTNHFRLGAQWLRAHGFQAQSNPAKGPRVTSAVLNIAWKEGVTESPLIIRRVLVFPDVSFQNGEERKAWIQRMIQSIRTRRIMRRAGILKPSHA